MSLRAKAFEKRLWTQLREHDLRRQMSFWRRLLMVLRYPVVARLWFFRALVFLLINGIVLSNRDLVGTYASIWVAVMGLWGLLAAQGTATMLLNSAAGDPQYRTLWMLPLAADYICRYLKHRTVWAGVWLMIEFLVLYLLVPSSNKALSIVFAGLQGAAMIALALLIVRLSIRFEKTLIVWILPALPGLLLFTESAPIVQLGTRLLYLHPFGWVNAVYVEGCIRGNSEAWWALAPIAGLLATIPSSLRSLRRLNANGIFRVAPGKLKWLERRSSVEPGNAAKRAGLIERLLTRFLNSDEQIIVETLVIDRPCWTKEFYAVLLYAAAFLAANSFIHFHSLMDLVQAAVLNFDDAVAESIAGCVASAVLFPFMLGHGLRLFAWYLWPDFRLLPINHWEPVKVIAKVNTVIVLLLVPPALIVSLTPLFQMLDAFGWRGSAVIPKALVAVWAFTLFLPSLFLNPSLASFRYWRSFLAVVTMFLILGAFGFGLFKSPTVISDFVLITALLALVPAWLLYCGYRYRRGFRP